MKLKLTSITFKKQYNLKSNVFVRLNYSAKVNIKTDKFTLRKSISKAKLCK